MLPCFVSSPTFHSRICTQRNQSKHYKCRPQEQVASKFFQSVVSTQQQRSVIYNCASSSSSKQTLYEILGIPNSPDPRSLSIADIRNAYIKLAKLEHPDVEGGSGDFDRVTYAWGILGDEQKRRIYDASGEEGLKAVQSIVERKREIDDNLSTMTGDQLDMMSETGQLLNGALLSPAPLSSDGDVDVIEGEENDACPRSIEEAIYNISSHQDVSVQYYTLWWVYRFKVNEAEQVITDLLSSTQPARLKRRAALALGVMAEKESSVKVLINAFNKTKDYFLRYRCAEALSNTAYRVQAGVGIDFSRLKVSDDLLQVLRRGGEAIKQRAENKTGFTNQESLFDLDSIEDDETRERLRKVFEKRKQQEQMSKRTTMTPQLGVQKVGSTNSEDDEPYEWIIKAVCAILQVSSCEDTETKEIINILTPFTRHELPLVRYAAHKALFCLSGDTVYADAIISALDYGVEHHYSQRVLCRDLGDMGYWRGAEAITACPMVENSFKILALKNMLGKLDYDASTPEVQQVLIQMDSLL